MLKYKGLCVLLIYDSKYFSLYSKSNLDCWPQIELQPCLICNCYLAQGGAAHEAPPWLQPLFVDKLAISVLWSFSLSPGHLYSKFEVLPISPNTDYCLKSTLSPDFSGDICTDLWGPGGTPGPILTSRATPKNNFIGLHLHRNRKMYLGKYTLSIFSCVDMWCPEMGMSVNSKPLCFICLTLHVAQQCT